MITTKQTSRPLTRFRMACMLGIGAVALSIRPALAQQAATREPPELQPPATLRGGGGVGDAAAQTTTAQNEQTRAELQAARAEVEQLRAALALADRRLEELEEKRTAEAAKEPAATPSKPGGPAALPGSGAPAAKAVPSGPMSNGGYRVLQSDGSIVAYSPDGKIITVTQSGVTPPAAKGYTGGGGMNVMKGSAPAAGTQDIAKKLDRLELQVQALSVEIARLKSEVDRGAPADPSNKPGSP
jgi:hypothetical protein